MSLIGLCRLLPNDNKNTEDDNGKNYIANIYHSYCHRHQEDMGFDLMNLDI